jgi:sialic acid synthase SpsE
MEIKFGNRTIGLNHPTYFIADIAANHDGDLDRAKLLIRLAKEAGADAAKFQNFDAPKIVSDYGFSHMNGTGQPSGNVEEIRDRGLSRRLHSRSIGP